VRGTVLACVATSSRLTLKQHTRIVGGCRTPHGHSTVKAPLTAVPLAISTKQRPTLADVSTEVSNAVVPIQNSLTAKQEHSRYVVHAK